MLTKCSFTIYFSLSTLSGIAVYALARELNFAWMDSAPCSPRRPNPTWVSLPHSVAWSSKMCILIDLEMQYESGQGIPDVDQYVSHVHMQEFRAYMYLAYWKHQWSRCRIFHGTLQTRWINWQTSLFHFQPFQTCEAVFCAAPRIDLHNLLMLETYINVWHDDSSTHHIIVLCLTLSAAYTWLPMKAPPKYRWRWTSNPCKALSNCFTKLHWIRTLSVQL